MQHTDIQNLELRKSSLFNVIQSMEESGKADTQKLIFNLFFTEYVDVKRRIEKQNKPKRNHVQAVLEFA